MDSILKSFFHVLLLFLIANFGFLLPLVNANSGHKSLVYSKCSNQTYYSLFYSEFHSQTLSSLFQQLLAQSSLSRFFKSTAGNQRLGISGFFQCRGDIGNDDCHSCVSSLPEELKTMCKQAVTARVQLNGCYLQYETDGFTEETPQNKLLHQFCSEEKAVDGGFVEVRDAAFLAMQSAEESEKAFYEVDYENVHVSAQCQGDLGGCDCSECVKIAVELAQEDCGSSLSGKVYLENCFLSYAYIPHGTPGSDDQGGGNNDRIGKKVAIVLGGTASLCVGFLLFKHLKSSCKKDDI